MRRMTTGLLMLCCASLAAAAEPRVSFEIITRPGLPPTSAQQWYQALSGLGVAGLQIRSGSEADEMNVEQTGTPALPAFRVTGILAADNMLHVPGGKFGVRDAGKLKKWIADLGADGVEGVTAPRAAFGLTPSQLEQVYDDLRQPLGFSTLGMHADQAVTKIARKLRAAIKPQPGTAGELARVTLADEFKDLTCGTALAAIARPAGLVLVPRRAPGGPIEYQLVKPAKGQEAWPVGWPPKNRSADELPVMFEMLNVEISEIPVSEALDAIRGRLAVPLVFDRNAMALHGADPTTAPADVPAKRMSYSQVLNKILFQARLKYEVRVDEADKPFLWITTVKPAP